MKARCCLAALALLLGAPPAAALITGTSTVSNCGEGGNWIELAFTSDTAITLVDAHWDFTATSVWLDRDGISICTPHNHGVTSYSFYFDDPPGVDTQTFGLTATGFDSGDDFRFVMDLDLGPTGSPYSSDYYGATVRVEFSNGTILNATFDTPYDSPNGATATFHSPQADLAFDAKDGWYAPVVPRAAADATFTSVPAPAALAGGAASTWFNAVCRNLGDATAGPSHMNVYVDGAQACAHALWTISPGLYNGWNNDGPHTVRGGRHTVKAVADVAGEVAESDETNNIVARQWIWAPPALPLETVQTRAAPPPASADTEYLTTYWYNCDGLRITPDASRRWSAVWLEALSGLNPQYTLRLHPASTGPEDGFGTNYAISGMTERTRAVLLNTRQVAQVPYDVGVLNYGGAGATADYRLAHIANSPYPFDFGIEPTTPYFGTRLLSFEFRVDAADLGPASLTLYSDPDDGPVHMGWLPPAFTYGTLASLSDRVTTDADGLARIDLNLTATGYYLAVVYVNRDEHPDNMAVNVGLYKARPDLVPTVPSGWFASVVPRPAADALLFSCPEPDTLHGNAAATWMNGACLNDGTSDADTINYRIRVDGAHLWGAWNPGEWLAPGGLLEWRNRTGVSTPFAVAGGRHALSLNLDYYGVLSELSERNNAGGRQYCWSPLALEPGVPVSRPLLPARTGGWEDCRDATPVAWNCDGLRLPWSSLDPDGWWRGVAVMPENAFADADVALHLPLAGTSDGFGPAPLAESAWGAGQVDFVLVNYNDAPSGARDAGVAEGAGLRGAYTAEAAISDWLGSYPEGARGPYAMPAGHMLHLYEMRLAAGPLMVRLDDLGADVDWGLSLYSRSAPHLGKSDAMAGGIAWQAAAGSSEAILVNVPAQGYYCLAVWKAGAAGLATSGNYRLWFAPGATDVGPPDAPAATRLVAATPNPFNPQTTIVFDLAAPARCRLAVHDLQGRLVRSLVAADLPAGRHEARWDGRDRDGRPAASGVYVARLAADPGEGDLLKLTLTR